MRLFRAKQKITIGESDSLSQTKIFEGQLFCVIDETHLPDPRKNYPGNLKDFYEEVVPNTLLVKQFSQVAKTRSL